MICQSEYRGLSPVLPGFSWRLADLDRRPDLTALLDDPVYQGYVLKPLQQERARADQALAAVAAERVRADLAELGQARERARAEQAAAAAEAERARAERLAARLRALGMRPE